MTGNTGSDRKHRSFRLTPTVFEAEMRQLQDEHRSGRITADELHERVYAIADEAQAKVEEKQRGWTLPILSGVLLPDLGYHLWRAATGHPSWGSMLTTAGILASVCFQYDEDNLPPRRRLIGGLLIGAAISATFLWVVW